METRSLLCNCGPAGPVEVARHRRSSPGNPQIDDAHDPPRPDGPGRTPKPTNAAEETFLALGDGARLWLIEAASAGTARIKVKMGEAVELAALHGVGRVDWALGHAAGFGRFADGDLAPASRRTCPDNDVPPMMCTRCSPAPPRGKASADDHHLEPRG